MVDERGFRDANRQLLIGYFEKGDKYSRKLGFELEHILLKAETGEAVSYSGPGGARDVLVKLSERYERVLKDGDDIIGCESPGDVVTLEPAGQLEVSLGPCATVSEV